MLTEFRREIDAYTHKHFEAGPFPPYVQDYLHPLTPGILDELLIGARRFGVPTWIALGPYECGNVRMFFREEADILSEGLPSENRSNPCGIALFRYKGLILRQSWALPEGMVSAFDATGRILGSLREVGDTSVLRTNPNAYSLGTDA